MVHALSRAMFLFTGAIITVRRSAWSRLHQAFIGCCTARWQVVFMQLPLPVHGYSQHAVIFFGVVQEEQQVQPGLLGCII